MSEEKIIPAEECETMTDVRAGVDSIDRQLVALIIQRFGYMDAAARIKADRSSVRDEARKAEVIANVREIAGRHKLPHGLTDQLWEKLVEASIAYELGEWDKLKA